MKKLFINSQKSIFYTLNFRHINIKRLKFQLKYIILIKNY